MFGKKGAERSGVEKNSGPDEKKDASPIGRTVRIRFRKGCTIPYIYTYNGAKKVFSAPNRSM
ncbi:MAG: hypothetical protein K2K83_00950 [Rikenella sp.]|nr:hypothetical protein [Rikenella sp.]